MKLPYVLLLTGIVLMAAAFAVPKMFGGRAALRGELEREIETSGEIHMAAHSEDSAEAAEAQTSSESLNERIDSALNRGQGTASVLKWLGIGVALAGVVMLAVSNSNAKGK